ncbi:MAG: type II toxin-antitoxin system VapC family toxin [Azoarcus sp.]|jgi:predicted nucleic acid-binding protein|nr:type II toxin-antitoxin system VapC family toxin [Azoarcus sp.]
MIILDTNVVSEAMKPASHPAVRSWMNGQNPETLYLTSVTQAEILYGIAALPSGKRKDGLTSAFSGLLKYFAGRILPFDSETAHHYAQMATTAKAAGRAFPVQDGYIAAIAANRGFAVATRDTTPFEAGGVPIINPWIA